MKRHSIGKVLLYSGVTSKWFLGGPSLIFEELNEADGEQHGDCATEEEHAC
jgi:hypothetical protein